MPASYRSAETGVLLSLTPLLVASKKYLIG